FRFANQLSNEARQPTPGVRLLACRASLTRSGCASLGVATMTSNPSRSRRLEFWTVFILIPGICFGLAISGKVRRFNAGKTVEILRPLIAAARFASPTFRPLARAVGGLPARIDI